MIRSIIIDDEPGARTTLKGLLQQHVSFVEVVEEAASVKEAGEKIEKNQPDLVFLDIEMPYESGFALFDQFPKPDFKVIFVTAFDEFAIQAIRFSALDYLLKPVNPKELIHACQIVQQSIEEKEKKGDNISLLLEQLGMPKKSFTKIMIPVKNKYELIEIKQIIRIEGDKNYSHIHMEGGRKELISKTLKEYESMLEQNDFMRIFQSHLINLQHVVNYHKGRGGQVEMSDGSLLPVSREKKKELLDRITLI